ncbi:MAG: PAS domain S-box protein [Planctomycetota bacterium]|jgi:PAS domain S-box-containing protein
MKKAKKTRRKAAKPSGKRPSSGDKHAAETAWQTRRACCVLFDFVPMGIWLADMDGNLLDANHWMQRMTGYSLAEMKRKGLASTFYEEAAFARLLEYMRRRGGVSGLEALMKRKDSRPYWVVLDANVVELDGRRVFLAAQRHFSDERFNRNMVLFQREIIETMQAGLVIVRKSDGLITYANPQLEKMFGYDRGEMERKPGRILYAPKPGKSQREIFDELVEVLSKRGSWAGDIENIRKDGSVFWSNAVVSTLMSPWENEVWAWLFADITKRKKAESALRESEREYRTLVESVPVGIYRTTPDGQILLANSALVNMLGYSSFEELSSRNLERKGFEPGYSRKWFKETVEREGSVKGIESGWLTRDGSRVNVVESAAVVRDKGGNVLFYEGIVEDVTEQRLARDELRRAQAKLVRARDEERRRLAVELHDSVGQGLIALQLEIQSIVAAERDADPERLKQCEEVAARCVLLAQEVRQIGHGLYPPTLESLGLLPSLRELLGACDAVGVGVDLQCCDALQTSRLPSDVEISLFRIAQEAVNNALRHSKARHLDVKLDYREGLVTLAIVDNGIGFDVDSAGGEGLGLNSMRERAEAIGGALEITSRKGKTSVEVTAPAMLRET